MNSIKGVRYVKGILAFTVAMFALYGCGATTASSESRPGLTAAAENTDSVENGNGRVAAAQILGLQEGFTAEIAGVKVTAVKDFQKGVRIENGVETKLDYPASNVIYFEMENDNWVCVRPSGTEPKIKLYVASKADSQAAVDALNDKMTEEAKKLLA